jgi:transglutaminase-like putative cysteine protease
MTQGVRRVTAGLVLDIVEPLEMLVQVAVSTAGLAAADVIENLRATSNGAPVDLVEVMVAGNGRVHICRPPLGRVHIDYDATVIGYANPSHVTDDERIVYRRPSRYAESDRLARIAQAEFFGITDPSELLAAVSSWTGSKLRYVPGSSGPTEGAVDTMLKREGVCRDYAHIVIALLRGLDIPARLAAVYAPGLNPMDFHAVAEAAIGDEWRVVDATLLAPRSSLVRIATGRDAADTAFVSTYGGAAELLEVRVSATVDGPLPADDIHQLVSIR